MTDQNHSPRRWSRLSLLTGVALLSAVALTSAQVPTVPSAQSLVCPPITVTPCSLGVPIPCVTDTSPTACPLAALPAPIGGPCGGLVSPPTGRPINDDFACATNVTMVPYYSLEGIRGASLEKKETTGCAWGDVTMWFTWTARASGVGSITTTMTNNGYTGITVYTGPALGKLKNVACREGWPGAVTFPCTAGTTYRIQVTVFSWTQTDTLGVNINGCNTPELPPVPVTLPVNIDCLVASGRPTNDNFECATNVTAVPYSASESAAGASMQPKEKLLCGGWQDGTVWFRWTPQYTGTATVTSSGSWTPQVAIGTGPSVDKLKLVKCQVAWTQTPVTFACKVGTTYFIQVNVSSGQPDPLGVTIDGCTGNASLVDQLINWLT